jgi:hypothetical protein
MTLTRGSRRVGESSVRERDDLRRLAIFMRPRQCTSQCNELTTRRVLAVSSWIMQPNMGQADSHGPRGSSLARACLLGKTDSICLAVKWRFSALCLLYVPVSSTCLHHGMHPVSNNNARNCNYNWNCNCNRPLRDRNSQRGSLTRRKISQEATIQHHI